MVNFIRCKIKNAKCNVNKISTLVIIDISQNDTKSISEPRVAWIAKILVVKVLKDFRKIVLFDLIVLS